MVLTSNLFHCVVFNQFASTFPNVCFKHSAPLLFPSLHLLLSSFHFCLLPLLSSYFRRYQCFHSVFFLIIVTFHLSLPRLLSPCILFSILVWSPLSLTFLVFPWLFSSFLDLSPHSLPCLLIPCVFSSFLALPSLSMTCLPILYSFTL